MFNLGWSEILMIAVVAIIVVGPKDLPRMLRSLGKTMGQFRRTANEFKRQFDDALKEAEQQADFEDTRKSLEGLGNIDPLADVKKELDSVSTAGSDIKSAVEKPVDSSTTAKSGAKTSPPAKKAAGAKGRKPAAKSKPKAAQSKPAQPKAAGSAKAKPKPARKAARAKAPASGSDAA
jgi:sec-independent protein translocase protein TatB